MGHHSSPLIPAANIDHLLSDLAVAMTVGGITWQLRQKGNAYDGEVQVRTKINDLARCRLRIYVSRLKPSEPTLAYLVGSGRTAFPASRLCINGSHGNKMTHKHRTRGDGSEDVYEPDDIPPVPLQSRVAPGTYRAILEAFAAECSVKLGEDFVWTDPLGRAS